MSILGSQTNERTSELTNQQIYERDRQLKHSKATCRTKHDPYSQFPVSFTCQDVRFTASSLLSRFLWHFKKGLTTLPVRKTLVDGNFRHLPN